jgi:predicted Fe-S protein YdhL (DUF1289 family)
MSEEVSSPCVNVCVLGLDNVCFGCHRTLEEITIWSHASNEERRRIVIDARQRSLDEDNV